MTGNVFPQTRSNYSVRLCNVWNVAFSLKPGAQPCITSKLFLHSFYKVCCGDKTSCPCPAYELSIGMTKYEKVKDLFFPEERRFRDLNPPSDCPVVAETGIF